MALVNCPKCGDILEDGECLAPHSVDDSVACKVCDSCLEGFVEEYDGWDIYEECYSE